MSQPIDSINIEQNEAFEELSAIRELNAFVTRIWEHPLVTPELTEKREQAVQYLSKYNSLDGVLLHPIGGQIWRLEKDLDYMLLYDAKPPQSVLEIIQEDLDQLYTTKNPNLPIIHLAGSEKLGNKFNTASMEYLHQEYKKSNGYLPFSVWESTVPNTAPTLANLYCIPDEYISGDKFYLKELRQKAINPNNYILNDGTGKSDPGQIQNIIRPLIDKSLRRIKEWPLQLFTHEVAKYPDFMSLLFKRARQSHVNPETYEAPEGEIHLDSDILHKV
jgi:hypothetical protein